MASVRGPAELLQAAGPDISPQLKMMVPHIAVLKMTIEEQENLLAAREPGFDPDAYGVMVDRLIAIDPHVL